MAEPYYCTATELRTELGVDSSTLSDAAALVLIETAEDLIDEDLGARYVSETTGRKVVQADVDSWRWVKLKRAATKLAAYLYRNPGALRNPQYRSMSGPDFSYSGPVGSRFGPEIDAPLNQSGLRRLTTTVGDGPGRPPWYDFVYNDTSWDYEPPPLPRQS